MNTIDQGRRKVLGAMAVVAGAGLLARAPQARAQDELPHLDEADPTAAALGYKHDTATVDGTKYPNHKAEQVCANCNLIQGKDGDAWRPCAIFPGKAVNAKGWCTAYVPKA